MSHSNGPPDLTDEELVARLEAHREEERDGRLVRLTNEQEVREYFKRLRRQAS